MRKKVNYNILPFRDNNSWENTTSGRYFYRNARSYGWKRWLKKPFQEIFNLKKITINDSLLHWRTKLFWFATACV